VSRHQFSSPHASVILSGAHFSGVEGPASVLDQASSATKCPVPRPFAPFANGRETSTLQSSNVILSERSESKDLRLLFSLPINAAFPSRRFRHEQ